MDSVISLHYKTKFLGMTNKIKLNKRKYTLIVKALVAIVLSVFIFSSCKPTKHVLRDFDNLKEVKFAQLKNTDATIKAYDGSYTIKSGKKTALKEQSESVLILYDNEIKVVKNVDEIRYTNGGKTISRSENIGKWEDAYKKVLKFGGKKVIVSIPEADDDLYGVLFLGKTHPEAERVRAYKIRITEKQLDDMRSNGVGVSGKDVDLENGLVALSWSLWLTEKPFGSRRNSDDDDDDYSMSEEEEFDYEEDDGGGEGSSGDDYEEEYEFEEEGVEEEEEEVDDFASDYYYGLGCRLEKTEKGYLEVLAVYSKSPAKKAGLKKGDIIGKMNGALVSKMSSKAYKKMTSKKGNKIELEIKRKGKKKKLTVRVGKIYK